MATSELLETYLNDHLAGATAGVDLARQIAEGTGAGAAMARLADDIAADRDVLEALVDKLGLAQHTVKHAAAWMAEKATRLRLNRVAAGSDGMALLMSLEALSMGVDGKRDLWQTLGEVADAEPTVAALDLDGLLQRAEAQHHVIEVHRRALAPSALGYS